MVDLAQFGKIPPQARDLEESVLGACLLDNEAISKTLSVLTCECFYVTGNGFIFQCIEKLYTTSRAVDILTVTEELKKIGKLEEVGGPFYISELTDRVISSAHAEHHSLIIFQKYIQREIIRVSTLAIKESYEDTTDVFKLLDDLISQLISVTSKISSNSVKHISKASHENYLRIEKLSTESEKLLGYSTGLTDLDKLTYGLQPGVTVIAGRPSMGKSALLSQIVISLGKQEIPVQIFTLEVNIYKYELRMKSQMSRINFERIQTGDIRRDEWEKLMNISGEISDLPIWVDDCATLSKVQLRSKCLQAYSERKIRCFAIDFIQLADGGNDYEQLSEMSRTVKIISQELGVPFIELSQLSREVERRPDKKPMLSDLRQTGSIEQDADVVMLLYRPEYYGLKAFDKDKQEVNAEGFAQLRVAKNKDGKVGTVDLNFIGENVLFTDYKTSNQFPV